MPIYDATLRQKLKEKGLDPDEFDLVDSAENQSAPISNTPTTIQPKIKSSTFGAGARAFGTGVLPTTAGLVGGSLAAAPFTGGVSIPIGLAAGIVTSLIAGKAQQAGIEAVSPELAQQLQADVEQHPTATTIGGLAASLPTLRPSLKSLPGAGRAIRDIVTPGIRPHASDVGNLLNVGLGATVPPAIRLATDPNVSAGNLALESLGGALINDPRKWTTKIGLHPNVYREDIFKDARLAQRPGAIDVESEVIPETDPTRIKPKIPIQSEGTYQVGQYRKPKTYQGYEAEKVSESTQSGTIGDIKELEIKAKQETESLRKLRAAEERSQKEAERLAKIYRLQDKEVAENFGISLDELYKLSPEKQSAFRSEYKKQIEQAKLEKEATEEKLAIEREKPKESILKPEELTTDEETLKTLAARKLAQETIAKAPEKVDTGVKEVPIVGEKPITVEHEVISETEGTIKERGTKKYSEEESSKLPLQEEKNKLESEWVKANDAFDEAHEDFKQAKLMYGSNTLEYQMALAKRGEASKKLSLLERKLSQLEGPRDLSKQSEEESKLSEIALKRQTPLIEGAAKENISLTPTNRLFQMFQKLGALRNIRLVNGRPVKTVTNPDGSVREVEVKGQIAIRDGLKEVIAQINPNKATIEDAPHELLHGFRDDMKKHGNDFEKKMITKGDRLVEKSPDYLEWKAAREKEGKSPTVDEYLTIHGSEDAIRRVLRTDGEGKFKSFLKDFWSAVKVKYGGANEKDFVRLLSNKLINDAPFHETFGKGKSDTIVKAADSTKEEEKPYPFFSEDEGLMNEKEVTDERSKLEDARELASKEYKKAKQAYDDTLRLHGADSVEHQKAIAEMTRTGRAFQEIRNKFDNVHPIRDPYMEVAKNAESEESPLDKAKENEFKKPIDLYKSQQELILAYNNAKNKVNFFEQIYNASKTEKGITPDELKGIKDGFDRAQAEVIELHDKLFQNYPDLFGKAKNAEEESSKLPTKSTKTWQELRSKDNEVFDSIKDWISGVGEKPSEPSILYRGIPKGAILGDESHASPWGYVASRGGKGGFGDPRSHDVYEFPVNKEQKYYRGGALKESPLEFTRIMNEKGMTWNDILDRAKSIYDTRLARRYKQLEQDAKENNFDQDWLKSTKEQAQETEANRIVDDIRNASFETDLKNKPGRWSEGNLPKKFNRPYPKLATNEELSAADKLKKQSEDEGSKLPTQKFSEDSTTQKLKLVAEKHNIDPSTLPISRTEAELHLMKLRPEIDKIPDPVVRDAFTDFYERITENRGKYVNKTLRNVRNLADLSSLIKNITTHPLDYLKQDTTELSHVREWFDNAQDKKPNIQLTENETKIRDAIKESLRQVRVDQNTRKYLRKGGFNPDYLPQTPDSSIINELQENPNSDKSKTYKQQFLDYQIKSEGQTKEEAADNLKTFLDGFTKEKINLAEQFGPIDRAEGLGIPPEWREKNLLDRLNRYFERVSRRFAYHDSIEAKEGVLDSIKSHRGNTAVSNVYDNITGINPKQERWRSAAGGLIRAGMMGTMTGIKDFTSNITLGMQHQQNPLQTIRSTLDAWSNMSKNISDSFLTGRNRTNMNALEWSDTPDIVSYLRRFRDVVSDIQGRNWLEQMTRATAFGMGRFTTLDFHSQFHNGNLSKQGKKWFDDFGKDVNWKKAELSNDDILKISSRFVDSVQGTYDYRGLPVIAMEGTLSPVLALARWNIEKSNNFMKHVVTPLKNGNPYPAIMATLGGVLGGTAITKIVENITGRKEKTPKFKEIEAVSEAEGKSTIMPLAYKLMGLASMSGYAGALSDIVRGTMDVVYGRNKPVWYNNVLLEAASNMADLGFSLTKSINDNGYSPELIGDFLSKALEDNLQTFRIILAHTSAQKQEDIERANKFRDLRVYNTLAGNPIVDLSSEWGRNQFGPDDIKDFKRTKDPIKAAELLPKLISKALENAGSDPDKLRYELNKIKRNSYQTMPSPDNMPYRFMKYLTFLRKTQGEEAASARLVDYIEQNTVNRAKAGAVP